MPWKELDIDWVVEATGKFTTKKEAEKHRYLYFIGNKKEKKLFMSVLKHPLLPYPKGEFKKALIIKHEVKTKEFYE